MALLLGGIAAASQGCGALRRDTGDQTLRRLLGVGTRQALIARAILPALLSSAWLALALALLVAAGVLHGWGWPVLGVLGGPGLVPAALRTARTAPVDTAAQGGIDTGMGATPPWLVNRVMSILLGGLGTIPLLVTVISAVRGIALGKPAYSPSAGRSSFSCSCRPSSSPATPHRRDLPERLALDVPFTRPGGWP